MSCLFVNKYKLWEKAITQYLHDISAFTKCHEISNELVLDLDKTLSRFCCSVSKMTRVTGKHYIALTVI